MAFAKTRRAAGVYVLLTGLNRAVAMLILPFVSRVFSPAEFGAATTVSATSFLIVSVLASPLEALIMYAAPRKGDEPLALLRVAGLYCYVLVPVFSLIPAAVFALTIPQFLGISGQIWAIEIVAVGLMPATIVYALPMVKTAQNLRKFMWLAIGSIAFMAISKVLLVIIWRHGLFGWVVSDLFTAASTAIAAMILVRLPAARVTRRDVRKVADFALPLVPHTAANSAIFSLSRPALALVSTLTQVGFLSVGLTVASAVTIVLTEVLRAVAPQFSQETFPAPTDKTFGAVRWLVVLAAAVPAAAGCVLASAGQWIFASPYWPAFTLTGILLVGQAMLGYYMAAINYLVLTAGITKYTSIASGTGALVIALSVFGMGARYGAIGVAYGIAAGYFAMTVAAILLTKVAKLDVVWARWSGCWPECLTSAMALAFSVAAVSQPVNSPSSWWLSGASAVLLGFALFLVTRRRTMN